MPSKVEDAACIRPVTRALWPCPALPCPPSLTCLPACKIKCATGKGVHVVTVNDYLARRDSEWVGQVHRFLGLDVGLVQTGLTVRQ